MSLERGEGRGGYRDGANELGGSLGEGRMRGWGDGEGGEGNSARERER
jgi:hypothetical protein